MSSNDKTKKTLGVGDPKKKLDKGTKDAKDDGKERVVMFGLDEENCDVSILTEEKIIFVKSNFLRYVLGDNFNAIVTSSDSDHEEETKFKINLQMESVACEQSVEFALSFYNPLYSKVIINGRSDASLYQTLFHRIYLFGDLQKSSSIVFTIKQN